jgi:hypothetical protein
MLGKPAGGRDLCCMYHLLEVTYCTGEEEKVVDVAPNY